MMNKDRQRTVLYRSLWDLMERLPGSQGPKRALLLRQFDRTVKAFLSTCNCDAARRAAEPLIHEARRFS